MLVLNWTGMGFGDLEMTGKVWKPPKGEKGKMTNEKW